MNYRTSTEVISSSLELAPLDMISYIRIRFLTFNRKKAAGIQVEDCWKGTGTITFGGHVEEEKTFQKLRENEREFRKQIILDSALNLFEKKTFSKTSMADIAKEVGVSTSTLYSYFPSQEELFLEAFMRDLSHIDKMFSQDGLGTTIEKMDQAALEALADAILGHLMNSEATFQMISLLITETTMPPHILKKFNYFRNEFHERITNVLRISGIKNPDHTTSRAFIASVLGAIMIFRNNPEHDDEKPEVAVKDLVRYIVNVFKAGIPVLEQMKNNF